jgi:hypothetical protein
MWISNAQLDLINCTFSISCVRNPDQAGCAFELRFEQVRDVRVDRYHDPDTCLGNWSPIEMAPIDPHRAQFQLDTGDAQVLFEAATEPSVTIFDGVPVPRAKLFTERPVKR